MMIVCIFDTALHQPKKFANKEHAQNILTVLEDAQSQLCDIST